MPGIVQAQVKVPDPTRPKRGPLVIGGLRGMRLKGIDPSGPLGTLAEVSRAMVDHPDPRPVARLKHDSKNLSSF